ncbi:hypothetical protein SASPL_131307 [Salvia splendens]|uniref:Uncharacterized protein n=1 Tax=Salvia splendens TaxID=180675 RepID=A0A8X8ZK71_SALSN|nr:hypothetical protein SASPL_131307 [Salvia splendens]
MLPEQLPDATPVASVAPTPLLILPSIHPQRSSPSSAFRGDSQSSSLSEWRNSAAASLQLSPATKMSFSAADPLGPKEVAHWILQIQFLSKFCITFDFRKKCEIVL